MTPAMSLFLSTFSASLNLVRWCGVGSVRRMRGVRRVRGMRGVGDVRRVRGLSDVRGELWVEVCSAKSLATLVALTAAVASWSVVHSKVRCISV